MSVCLQCKLCTNQINFALFSIIYRVVSFNFLYSNTAKLLLYGLLHYFCILYQKLGLFWSLIDLSTAMHHLLQLYIYLIS